MKVKEFLKALENGMSAEITVYNIFRKNVNAYCKFDTKYIVHKSDTGDVSVSINKMSDVNNFVTEETMLDMEIKPNSKISMEYNYAYKGGILKIELYVNNKN